MELHRLRQSSSPLATWLAATACLTLSINSSAAETTVYKLEPQQGMTLQSPLVAGPNGALFGVAFLGGTGDCYGHGCGTVFKIRPGPLGSPAKLTVIHHFADLAEGYKPVAVIPDGEGGLYGLTFFGGLVAPRCLNGCGTFFRLSPPAEGQTKWTHTVLYNFQARRDGQYPNANLVMDKNGALYGVTSSGGGTTSCAGFPPSCGTVFQLKPMNAAKTIWSETVIYRFTGGSDGGSPQGGLTIDPATGTLYGTVWNGGKEDICCGVVYRLNPPKLEGRPWRFTTLYAFKDGVDGSSPVGTLAHAVGVIYGTALHGGKYDRGHVYDLKPSGNKDAPWIKTRLYDLRFRDGEYPWSGVTRNAKGELYATAFTGGLRDADQTRCSATGCGTVFKLTPPGMGSTEWRFENLHQFSGDDGKGPLSEVTFVGRRGFGTTQTGGNLSSCEDSFSETYGCGVVFEVAQ